MTVLFKTHAILDYLRDWEFKTLHAHGPVTAAAPGELTGNKVYQWEYPGKQLHILQNLLKKTIDKAMYTYGTIQHCTSIKWMYWKRKLHKNSNIQYNMYRSTLKKSASLASIS